jgi:hypothetical protein
VTVQFPFDSPAKAFDANMAEDRIKTGRRIDI